MQSTLVREVNLSTAEVVDDFRPGKYRRQYLAAARSNGWGRIGARCGSAVLVRYVLGHLSVVPALCGCWACNLCGVRRAAWLKAELQKALARDGLIAFWTLTLWRSADPSEAEQIESFRVAKAAWNIVRTRLVQLYGKFSYVWTAESTKAGIGHLHLLTSSGVSSAELVGLWAKATETVSGVCSYILNVEPVDSGRVCDYLTKYCTQQVSARPAGLAGTRVFSKSRSVAFDPFRPPSAHPEEWQRWSRPYWDAVEKLIAAGAELERGWGEGSPFAEFRDTSGLVGGVPAIVVVGFSP